jgi:hypothetical protein
MNGIKHAQDKLNEESVKTADPEAFDRYLRSTPRCTTRSGTRLKRRWARNRFGTYIRKPAVLDAHLQAASKPTGAGTRAAYIGGGRWSPSQEGDDAR